MVTVNLGLHGGVPNLFSLPAPAYAGTVPAGTPSTAPMAAACVKSAPAARVDKSGLETALKKQRLANCEARLRKEISISPVPNAMAGANVSIARWLNQGQTSPVIHS